MAADADPLGIDIVALRQHVEGVRRGPAEGHQRL